MFNADFPIFLLLGLPGVVFILPDSYIDPVNKEYGGMHMSKLTRTKFAFIVNQVIYPPDEISLRY